jgi:hypothetical protein
MGYSKKLGAEVKDEKTERGEKNYFTAVKKAPRLKAKNRAALAFDLDRVKISQLADFDRLFKKFASSDAGEELGRLFPAGFGCRFSEHGPGDFAVGTITVSFGPKLDDIHHCGNSS